MRPYREQQVRIPYDTQGLGYERPLEPQVVKVLSQNRAKFYLRGEYPLTANTWQFPLVGGQRVKRLGITRVRLQYNIFNVTPENNVVMFYVTGISAVYLRIYRALLTPGQYTQTELATELVTQLNNSYGVTAFSISAPDTDNPYLFKLVFSSLLYTCAFINSYTNTLSPSFNDKNGISTALNRAYGLGLAGVDFSDADTAATPTNDTFWLYMGGYGPRYFDVCSQALTMDSKTMLPDLESPAGMMTRIFLPHPFKGEVDEVYTDPISWFNVEDRPITSVDLKVIPEYQNTTTNQAPSYPQAIGPWGLTRINVDVEVTIEF